MSKPPTTKLDAYELALKEISRKNANIKRVMALLEASLKEGNPKAAYALGTWYFHGHHVKKNLPTGVRLFRQAAKANIPDALYDLALCYERGVGARQNNKLAMQTYLRAALYGDPQATYEVGRCYYFGIGTAKNRQVAWIWLDRAKELGVQNRNDGSPDRMR